MKKVSAALRSIWARTMLSLVVLAVIAYFAHQHFGFIEDGWKQLREAENKWLAVAVLFMILTMLAQAEVMVTLLRSAGINVKRISANVLGLVANSWSASFPGGPALSAAMIFREQLRWGASPVIASWYMIFSGLLSGAGMALLAIGSVFFLGLKAKTSTLVVSVIAVIALATITNWAARNPDRVEQWLIERLKAFNRWRGKSENRLVETLRGFAEQLSTVNLPLPRLGIAITFSLLNWIFEIICLLACVHAVGGTPPVAGVVLSFLTAKLIGQAQVTPGGLGPVDLALTSTLIAVATLTSSQAFAAVIVFRMISFVGLVAVGWVVYFLSKLRTPLGLASEQKSDQETAR